MYIRNKTNAFKFPRELFYYLDNYKLPYTLLLEDTKERKVYFLEFKCENNWLSSSFHRCDKEELFLGKQVLNYQSNIGRIIDTILKKIN